MTLKEQITVMQAKLDDPDVMIQAQEHGTNNWVDCVPDPCWNFARHDYRVKSPPKPYVPKWIAWSRTR